jgi:hypothetical protein
MWKMCSLVQFCYWRPALSHSRAYRPSPNVPQRQQLLIRPDRRQPRGIKGLVFPSISSRLLLLGLGCSLLALWRTREIKRFDEFPRTLVDDDVVCLIDVGQGLDVLLFDGVGQFHEHLVEARGVVLVGALCMCQRAFVSISKGIDLQPPPSLCVGWPGPS